MQRGAAAVILSVLVLLSAGACGRQEASSDSQKPEPETTQNQGSGNREAEDDAEMKMQVEAGGRAFTAVMEDNEAAAELMNMLEESPVVIEMDEYGGFEKVGDLGTQLPADDSRMTTKAGDIVLYNGSQIVMFYGSNSWSYTKLASIEDLSGWEEALGDGGVTVTFSAEQPAQ